MKCNIEFVGNAERLTEDGHNLTLQKGRDQTTFQSLIANLVEKTKCYMCYS